MFWKEIDEWLRQAARKQKQANNMYGTWYGDARYQNDRSQRRFCGESKGKAGVLVGRPATDNTGLSHFLNLISLWILEKRSTLRSQRWEYYTASCQQLPQSQEELDEIFHQNCADRCHVRPDVAQHESSNCHYPVMAVGDVPTHIPYS